jgi:hypothetical protein
MRPYWPCFQLRGRVSEYPAATGTQTEVVLAQPDDPDLVQWDRDISGRFRPEDHAYWIAHRGGVPLWFVRNGKRVGYGYAQTLSDDLPSASETVTVGPVGTRGDADACVLAAVRWASERAPTIRVALPAPHPALPPLLDLGLRIHDVDTFCSTREPTFIDARCYVPSGGDLF